jgi:hypothetical protein
MLESIVVNSFAWLGLLMIIGVSALYVYWQFKKDQE